MTNTSLMAVILAAGKGTRMVSELPKVCHTLGGRSMLAYVLEAVRSLGCENIVTVIGCNMPQVEKIVDEFSATHRINIDKVTQEERKGTGHALMVANSYLKGFEGNIMVLFGDTPLITPKTLQKLLEKKTENHEASIVLTAIRPQDPQQYGRIFLKPNGDVDRIVEYADATPIQLENHLCNGGVMVIEGKKLSPLLEKLRCNNASGEYYLTDLVTVANSQNLRVAFVEAEATELAGINTRQDLSEAENILQHRWRQQAMTNGATLIDPHTIFFSYDTKIGPDVTIEPYVVFGPGVEIKNGATIRSFCRLHGSIVEEEAILGPFAHLRPDTHIGKKVRIGNFVEVKKSHVHQSTKINHLSYIGDCEIGEYTNIGAGTITCNYDGFQKFQTIIGKNVSVGAHTSLIAPVEVGEEAVIGAGSVITRKVPANSLSYSRAPQQDILEGARRYRQKRLKNIARKG